MGFRDAQIAFAGHNRATHIGNRKAAEAGLAAGFALLGKTELASPRLLTGLADGADVLAVAAWRKAGLGPIHAVYPFLTDTPPDEPPEGVETATWIDGAALEAAGSSAHLAQTRWLIAAADLLVVLWDGKAGRGAGGTADAVRLALDAGVAVLWIEPDRDAAPRLISPPASSRDYDFMELLEQLDRGLDRVAPPATAKAISAALTARGFDEAESVTAFPEPSGLDRLLHTTLWRTYAVFRRVLGGSVRGGIPAIPPPADLLAAPGFEALTAAYIVADRQADQLASIHRSQQLLLLAAAVLATAIGVSPAVWPQIKIYAVLSELTLALIALAVWSGAERASRHERWGVARRLAEQLRLERAAWALGLSSVEDADGLGPAVRTARAVRRRSGLASGAFDAQRVSRWGGWAIDELLTSQAAYHKRQGHRNEVIDHRIHAGENLSFAVFVVCLAAFAIAHEAARVADFELPHWLGGAVLMLSAIIPAIGAASLALEANLGFREQSERSHFLAERLITIRASLSKAPRLDELQRAAKEAIRLHNSREDRWGAEAARRRLLRGG